MTPPMAKAGEAIKRLQDRREKTGRELLDAARRVIAVKGYERTKILDIAREAHIGVGTFYLYYPTKQTILLQLVEETYRDLKVEMDAIRQRVRAPDAFIRESTAMFLRFAQANRELFRIMFQHGPELQEVTKKAHEVFVGDTVANLAAGMDAGLFRRNRPEVVANAVTGLCIQAVSWWLEHQEITIDEIGEAVMDLLFHGILAKES
jgi:AcrR family transcriptional regulator